MIEFEDSKQVKVVSIDELIAKPTLNDDEINFLLAHADILPDKAWKRLGINPNAPVVPSPKAEVVDTIEEPLTELEESVEKPKKK